VVRRGFVCDTDRISRLSPELDVEALIGFPYGFSNAQPAPAAAKDDGAAPPEPAAVEDKPAEPTTEGSPK
jgi:hypothetical protein